MLDLTGSMGDKEKNCMSQVKYLEKLHSGFGEKSKGMVGGLEAIQGEPALCQWGFLFVCLFYISYLIESSQCFSREEKGTQSDSVTQGHSCVMVGGICI